MLRNDSRNMDAHGRLRNLSRDGHGTVTFTLPNHKKYFKNKSNKNLQKHNFEDKNF